MISIKRGEGENSGLALADGTRFRNRFLWILSAGTILFFFALNFFTPLIEDDYRYSLGIHSISDIVNFSYRFYFTWGGRLTNSLAAFWLLLGKPVFNIANTVVYCAFIYLSYYHITGKARKVNPGLLLAINVFYWFLVPAWGQNFLWLDGSCNYLWTTTIILFFLAPFRKKYETEDFRLNRPLSILFFMAGLTAGWSIENSGAAVLFLLIAYFVTKHIRKNKVALFEILGAIGFLTGFILLIAAPGNSVRAEVAKEMGRGYFNEPFMVMLFKRFLDVTSNFIKYYGFAVMAISTILAFDLLHHQKLRINLFTCFYALAALASVYSMVLSPVFPARAFFITVVFSGLTLGNILMQFEIDLPEKIKRNCILIGLILLSFPVYTASKNTYGIYQKWQKRVEYIISEKNRGNLDVVVKAPIPAYDNHTAACGVGDISYDENDGWTKSIAEYFGLRSLKGIDNDEPW